MGEMQIPPLRYGMTNKRCGMTNNGMTTKDAYAAGATSPMTMALPPAASMAAFAAFENL
jgi:hypothetical protein